MADADKDALPPWAEIKDRPQLQGSGAGGGDYQSAARFNLAYNAGADSASIRKGLVVSNVISEEPPRLADFLSQNTVTGYDVEEGPDGAITMKAKP